MVITSSSLKKKKAAQKAEFDKVKDQIKQNMMMQKQNELVKAKLEELKVAAKVEVKI